MSADPDLSKHWADRGMFGFNLLIMLVDCYGTEALEWRPETVEMQIRDDFGVDVPDGCFDRLMTARSVLTSDSFFHSVPDFARACVSLSGHLTPEGVMVLPDLEDVAWGVTEALVISPPEDKETQPFSEEITAFIGMMLDEEGVITPPDVLRIGTREGNLAERVSYDYSDDPEMFSAIQGVESDKTDSINKTVLGRLHAMLNQLLALPLRNGSAAGVKAVLGKLPKTDRPMPLG